MTKPQNSNETTISPKYGVEIARFGRWIVTSKGILIQRIEPEPEEYFVNNASIHKLASMREVLENLLQENWLDVIDYHQFITSWFYKLSLTKVNPDPDEPDLSETLAEIQKLLEKKFSSSLSKL